MSDLKYKLLCSVVVIQTALICIGIIHYGNVSSKIVNSFGIDVTKTNTNLYKNTATAFSYTFNSPGVLKETGSIEDSKSPYWWLNSGGYLYIEDGVGKTVRGELPKFSIWRLAYARSNPSDTEDGYQPQNIFRLFTKSRWLNFSQEASFLIEKNNLINSERRNQSNGLLLISRYQENGDLYYMGIRVDGNAVIKKKVNGIYYTLAIKKIIPGEYDVITNPSLLPTNKWISIKSEINNISNSSVNLKLYTSIPNDSATSTVWEKVLEVNDDPQNRDEMGPLKSGLAGIRTDFMDVQFKNYKNVQI